MSDNKGQQWCRNFEAGHIDNVMRSASSIQNWLRAQAADQAATTNELTGATTIQKCSWKAYLNIPDTKDLI